MQRCCCRCFCCYVKQGFQGPWKAGLTSGTMSAAGDLLAQFLTGQLAKVGSSVSTVGHLLPPAMSLVQCDSCVCSNCIALPADGQQLFHLFNFLA